MVIFAVLLGGCVSASDTFDEFDDRVGTLDAAGFDGEPLTAIPDVSGEFFFAIDPVPISPGNLLRFIATVTLDIDAGGTTATMDLTIQPIDVANGELVADPIPFTNIAVNPAGGFTVELLTESDAIPGSANPVTGGNIGVDGQLQGRLLEAETDLFCGTASGNVIPTQTVIDGSTFGAVRIAPGTIGNANLPEPVTACPE